MPFIGISVPKRGLYGPRMSLAPGQDEQFRKLSALAWCEKCGAAILIDQTNPDRNTDKHTAWHERMEAKP